MPFSDETGVTGVCDTLTFEAIQPESSVRSLVNFTEEFAALSASDCAKACYSRHCVVAGFVPSGPTCRLAFTGDSPCGILPKVSDYNGTGIAELHCIQCAGVGHVIEATPQSATKGPEVDTTSALETTTPSGVTEASNGTTEGAVQVRRCVGNITFVAAPLVTEPTNIAKSTLTSSPLACAIECYAHGCTQAVFRPKSFHPSEIDGNINGVPCLLSFDPANCTADQPRVNDANTTESFLISCLNCCKFALLNSRLGCL